MTTTYSWQGQDKAAKPISSGNSFLNGEQIDLRALDPLDGRQSVNWGEGAGLARWIPHISDDDELKGSSLGHGNDLSCCGYAWRDPGGGSLKQDVLLGHGLSNSGKKRSRLLSKRAQRG